MSVDPSKARGSARYQDATYYFCSPGCMHCFVSNPAKYIANVASQTDANATPRPVQIAPSRRVHRDPVCGMTVDPFKAAASIEHGGQLYHFCCKGCAEKFSSDPAKFLSPTYKPGGMQRSRSDWWNSSSGHPEVRGRAESHPGRKSSGIAEVHGIRLPDGSRGSPIRPRSLPEVRHGARTRDAAGCQRERSGPARCIRRSCATRQVHVRSAAWRSNRRRSRQPKKRIPNSTT